MADTHPLLGDEFDRNWRDLDKRQGSAWSRLGRCRVETFYGTVQTWIVQTHRQKDAATADDDDAKAPPAKFTVFIEMVCADATFRRSLPPAVVETIIRQRDALTAQARSKASKAHMAARKERGEKIGYAKKKK